MYRHRRRQTAGEIRARRAFLFLLRLDARLYVESEGTEL